MTFHLECPILTLLTFYSYWSLKLSIARVTFPSISHNIFLSKCSSKMLLVYLISPIFSAWNSVIQNLIWIFFLSIHSFQVLARVPVINICGHICSYQWRIFLSRFSQCFQPHSNLIFLMSLCVHINIFILMCTHVYIHICLLCGYVYMTRE